MPDASYLIPRGRAIRLFVVLLAAMSLTACQTIKEPLAPEATTSPIEFVVLQLNDVYEISPLDGGRVGGIARVATIKKQLEKKNPNTIAVLAGDFLSPSLISSLSETVDGKRRRIAGAQMVAAMNAAGIDYVTFGNHEFDISEQSLQNRMDQAEFAFISSNVKRRAAETPARPFLQRGRPVPDYAVHTFTQSDGRIFRLGLIGLTLPFNQQDYVQYEDVFEAAGRAYRSAQAESDAVFAITHLAVEEDARLAETLPTIPLILGGHEHSDTLAFVGSTRIAKADANARTVYIHWITYRPDTGALDIWSQLMPITDDIRPDPETEAVVQEWEAKARQVIHDMGYDADATVANFPVLFDGREHAVRNVPTNFGRLVACAMLDADPEAEFAFLNSGSIRIDDQLIGQIQQRDILRALPFGGAIVHGRFSGDVLQRALEAGLVANRDAGGYFQTTGHIAYENGIISIDGAPIDPAATYDAVLPEFLSLGLEENLGFMKDAAAYNPIELTRMNGQPGNDLRDIVIRYLKEADWMNDCKLPASPGP